MQGALIEFSRLLKKKKKGRGHGGGKGTCWEEPGGVRGGCGCVQDAFYTCMKWAKGIFFYILKKSKPEANSHLSNLSPFPVMGLCAHQIVLHLFTAGDNQAVRNKSRSRGQPLGHTFNMDIGSGNVSNRI